jgi:hypothetical protein
MVERRHRRRGECRELNKRNGDGRDGFVLPALALSQHRER